MVTLMKLYKFQALVTLHPAADGRECPKLGPAPCRMVLLGRSGESGRSQFFAALVNVDDDRPSWPGSRRVLVTLRVADDAAADYLGIGRHFHLWLGGDVGEGIITRRLFV